MLSTKWSREDLSSFSSFKKTAYIILPLLVYFLVHDGAEVLLWAGVSQLMLVSSPKATEFLLTYSYTVQGTINGLAILLGLLAIWKIVKSEISGEEPGKAEASAEAKGVTEKMLTDYMFVGALALSSAIGFNVLFYLLGITESSQSFKNTANAQFGVVLFVGIILYGIVSPLAEEAVFRGLIYNRMKRCFPLPIAMILSSLLFGCYHGNMVQALYGTILGILIAYTYEKYASFTVPVLFHGTANIVIYAMTYYDGLSAIDKTTGIIMTIVSFLIAAVCLWRIKNKMNVEK